MLRMLMKIRFNYKPWAFFLNYKNSLLFSSKWLRHTTFVLYLTYTHTVKHTFRCFDNFYSIREEYEKTKCDMLYL